MENKSLEDIKIDRWYTERSIPGQGTSGCPKSFSATFPGNPSIKELSERAMQEIIFSGYGNRECSYPLFGSMDDRNVISSYVESLEDKSSGFVVLQESPVVGGMSWNEGLYIVKVKDKNLLGKLLKYNTGSYVMGEKSHTGGRKLSVTNFEKGVLKYVLEKDGEPTENFNFDLWFFDKI